MRIIRGKARKSLLVESLALGERAMVVDLGVGFNHWNESILVVRAEKPENEYLKSTLTDIMDFAINEEHQKNIFIYGNFVGEEVSRVLYILEKYDSAATITITVQDESIDHLVLEGF